MDVSVTLSQLKLQTYTSPKRALSENVTQADSACVNSGEQAQTALAGPVL